MLSLTKCSPLVYLAALALLGCGANQPLCPDNSPKLAVKSAGCMVLRQNQLLVVEGYNGKLSIPGGSGDANESAQCTAHRETWEETGLDVRPMELVRVFDNGFHLFRCDYDANSGRIDPPFRLEIKRAFWLAPEAFGQYHWRFPGQEKWLAQQIQQSSPELNSATEATSTPDKP